MTNDEKLYIDEEQNCAILLGYIMRLTKTELALLKHMRGIDEFTTASSLVERVLGGKALTEGNIAVHVCNINKKAKAISGRSIIKTCRFKGYKIAENI